MAMTDSIIDFNPYTSYSTALDTISALTLPSPFAVTPTYEYEPNGALLTTAPTTEVSADGKEQTVQYRISEDAVWSDGEPVTADDFLYLWEMSKAETIGYFPGFEEIANVEAPDAQTVDVTLQGPYADWEQLFDPLLPSHYMRSVESEHPSPGKAFEEALKDDLPVTSGPMKVENVQEDGMLVELVADESYAGAESPVQAITLRGIPDPSAAGSALLSGEVDVLVDDPVDLSVYEDLESSDDLNVDIAPSASFLQLTFNTKKSQLADSRVRQAIAYMVDRQRLNDMLFGGAAVDGLPGNHVVAPEQAGYVANDGDFPGLDPARARQLLEDAGYKFSGGSYTKNGKPLTIDLTTGSDRPELVQVSEVVADDLKQHGIQVTIKPENSADLSEILRNHNFEMAVHAWSWSAAPGADLVDTYGCQGYANYSQYCKAAVDRDLGKAKKDPGEQVDLLNTIDERLWEDMPTLPLFQRPAMIATAANIESGIYNAPAYTAFSDITEWHIN